MTAVLRAGFVPLVDAAPLIISDVMGFAGEEGLEQQLSPAPSWAALRDMLAGGQVDAARMLPPVPVALALGLGGLSAWFEVLPVLNVNGDVFGISSRLAARMPGAGFGCDRTDARAAGLSLLAAAGGSVAHRGAVSVFDVCRIGTVLAGWLGCGAAR